MKCEIAGTLLHQPKILFLDEPTIGLDVLMQRRIRHFLREYNRRHQATIILTSHYMADVEALCKRIIMIHQGQIHFDGRLTDLSERFAPFRTISFVLAEDVSFRADMIAWGQRSFISEDDQGERVRLRVLQSDVSPIITQLLANTSIKDLIVEEPPIDDIIEQAFVFNSTEDHLKV